MNTRLLSVELPGGILVAVISSLLAGAAAGRAATTNVNVSNGANSLSYSPPAVTINVGDAVQWTWNGTLQHSTTSDAPLWDSGQHASPFSFPFTFNSAGSYPYHCSNPFHTATMKGTVTVMAAANLPPTVAVTNPTTGAVLASPATLLVAATALDADGSVTNVQFFQGATSLTNQPTAPYSVIVSNLAAADYTFSAVATDNGGLKATNAIVVHVVTPVPIVLSSLQRLSASAVQFQYSANTGLSYIVLRGAALPALSPLKTNLATNSTVLHLDTDATGPANFYRVQRVPNP